MSLMSERKRKRREVSLGERPTKKPAIAASVGIVKVSIAQEDAEWAPVLGTRLRSERSERTTCVMNLIYPSLYSRTLPAPKSFF